MVQRLLTRYSQASPAPERAPRAKNGQAAVGHIFEGSVGLVCFEPRASLGVPPERSPTLGRRLGLTSLRQNPNHSSSSQLCSTPDAVACKRAAFSVCSHVPRDVFSAAPAWTAKRGPQAKLQTLSCSLYCSALQSAAAGPRRRKHRSARLKKRTRASRAATDDGRARHFRAASPHGRGGHG